MTAITVRLPDEMLHQLDEVAHDTERPRTFHILKALEHYLGECADLQIALDRQKDPHDKTISAEEMRRSLGL